MMKVFKRKNVKRNGKKPWFSEGLRFECQRCGDCCRGEPGVVWVTPDEVRSLAKCLNEPLADFVKRCVRRVGGRYSLKERPNGDCVLYKDGCIAYQCRPVQCKTFPFWSYNVGTEDEWNAVREECPGCGRGRLHPLEEIERAISRKHEVSDVAAHREKLPGL